MHATKHTLALAACSLATTALAQSSFQNDMSTDLSRSSISAALVNVTFSAADSPSCSSSSNSSSTSSNSTSSNALAISIRTIPSHKVCFNLDSTFRNPSTTYAIGNGNTCDDDEDVICGVNYTVTAAPRDGWLAGVEYSRVGYTQIRNPFALDNGARHGNGNGNGNGDEEGEAGTERRVGGRVEFQVYSGADCREKNGVASREWNCISVEGECDAVGFAVQSFSVEMTDPEKVGSGNCSIAKTGGAERLYGGRGGGGGGVLSVLGIGLAVVGAVF